jgi:hypothetical protein
MRARPAALCVGRGHMVVHGNEAFRTAFGERSVGLPVREALVDEPPETFALFDAVFEHGRPFARWVRRGGEDWRLIGVPRTDLETGEVYGVAFHLRARSDAPIVLNSPRSVAVDPLAGTEVPGD